MRSTVVVVVGLVLGFSFVAAMPAGAMTKSQLRSKLLTLSNMPTGWTVDNSSSGAGQRVVAAWPASSRPRSLR